MNRTKIEWTDFTWNPVVGCNRGCEYCYARKQAKRKKHTCLHCYNFKPHMHYERLDQPTKRRKSSKIFVCSMGELFSPETRNWVPSVLEIVKRNPQHLFQFLTKNPSEMARYHFPSNCWCGVSVEENKYLDRIIELGNVDCSLKFVSFEPLHGLIEWTYGKHIRIVDWIIIGAETGRGKGKISPEQHWVDNLVGDACECGKDIFIKDNVTCYLHKWQEFPSVDENTSYASAIPVLAAIPVLELSLRDFE